jgi:GxxExxY protein
VRTENAEEAERAELRGETQLLHGDLSHAIIGAFYSVYSELGFGFLEAVYANALTILLKRAGLAVERQVAFEIRFHGQSVGLYKADLVVESRIVVEIKASRCLIPQHASQLLNYLKASKLQVGVLLNFGERAEFKRVVCTGSSPR